jgi:hypothetical protein
VASPVAMGVEPTSISAHLTGHRPFLFLTCDKTHHPPPVPVWTPLPVLSRVLDGGNDN